jgi:hypothetical protein
MKNYAKLHLAHSLARCQEYDQNKTDRSDRCEIKIDRKRRLPPMNADNADKNENHSTVKTLPVMLNPIRVNPRSSAVNSLRSRRRALTKRFFQSADLRGVIVRVRRINLQPISHPVRTAFGVSTFALPIFLAHKFKQLRRS